MLVRAAAARGWVPLHHLEGRCGSLAAAGCRRDARGDERPEAEGALGVEGRVAVLVLEALLVLVPAKAEGEGVRVRGALPEVGDGLAGPVLLVEVVAAPEEAPASSREAREGARCGTEVLGIAGQNDCPLAGGSPRPTNLKRASDFGNQSRYQRNTRHPNTVPVAAGMSMPSRYQEAMKGASISGQCRQ